MLEEEIHCRVQKMYAPSKRCFATAPVSKLKTIAGIRVYIRHVHGEISRQLGLWYKQAQILCKQTALDGDQMLIV